MVSSSTTKCASKSFSFLNSQFRYLFNRLLGLATFLTNVTKCQMKIVCSLVREHSHCTAWGSIVHWVTNQGAEADIAGILIDFSMLEPCNGATHSQHQSSLFFYNSWEIPGLFPTSWLKVVDYSLWIQKYSPLSCIFPCVIRAWFRMHFLFWYVHSFVPLPRKKNMCYKISVSKALLLLCTSWYIVGSIII